MISRLHARSFKGLREFTISPKRVNLLIGANGTGKTNFADLIVFLSHLATRGLSDALDEFGGLAQVRTRQSGAGRPLKLQVELGLGADPSRGIHEASYRFSLAQSQDLRVQEEELEAVVYKRKPGRPARQGVPRFHHDQRIPLHFVRKDDDISQWSEALGPQPPEPVDASDLLLTLYGRLGELRTVTDYLGSWRSYNIDAAIAKQFMSSNEKELDRYGANIVPFVVRMLRDPDIAGRLLNDLREAVPYIKSVQPDRVLTLQTLRFTEQDSGVEFQLPEMSDGTIRLLGLLAMLRQPVPPAVIVIEEPENALHAYAIHHFLRVVRRVAMHAQFPSQVFLTSHSPTVVDEVLSPEAMRETEQQTACFVTQRRGNRPNIVPAPTSVMKGIADNLGRPSDFQREGDFGDEPVQLELPFAAESVP